MSGEQIAPCPHGVEHAAVEAAWEAEYEVEQQTGQRAALEVCSCCVGPCATGARRCRACSVEVQTHG